MKSLVGILMMSFSISTFAQTTPVGQEIEAPPKEKTPVSPVESSSRKVDKKLNKSKKKGEKYDNTPDTGVGGGSGNSNSNSDDNRKN